LRQKKDKTEYRDNNKKMSKVFEFHFNPTTTKRIVQNSLVKLDIKQNGIHRIPFFRKTQKPETLFNSFCFFPETRRENKLGRLYLMGEIKNVTPKTQNILYELAEVIKQEYYQFEYETPQDCFRAALERADEYLLEIKRENTDFLGNLSFAAISLLNDLSVSVSMTGNIKIFLLTGKNVFDVGNNFEQSPLRCFDNVIEGQLESRDKIVIITDQLFDTFYSQEIFSTLIDIKKAKSIKELFKTKKLYLNQTFGCCLLVLVKKGLPKIFLQSSKHQASTHSSVRPSFLQNNYIKIIFFGFILALLLFLGFLIFK